MKRPILLYALAFALLVACLATRSRLASDVLLFAGVLSALAGTASAVRAAGGGAT